MEGAQQQQQQQQQQLYSRQIGTLGLETQSRFGSLKVLVVGCGALGAEVAKNLVLAGPASVTLFDARTVRTDDLGANFLLGPEHAGELRSVACARQLAPLNDYVTVSAHTGSLSDEFVHYFDVVVMTDSTRSELERVNAYCRSRHKHATAAGHAHGDGEGRGGGGSGGGGGSVVLSPAGFICADVRGLCGYVLTDFGDSFEVRDPDGEPVFSGIISSATRANPGVVTMHEDHPHRLQDGDFVVFREVEGMEELNDGRPRAVRVINRLSFSVGDTSSYGEYRRQGIVEQVKVPARHRFASFRDLQANPFQRQELVSDFVKPSRPAHLHVAFQALFAYREESGGKLPELNHAGHASRVVDLAVAIAARNRQLPHGSALVLPDTEADRQELAEVARRLALHSRVELSPMAALIGGVVAQEVVKYTGKFTPLPAPLYLDFFDAAPVAPPPDAPPAASAAAASAASATTVSAPSRAAGQEFVFGRSVQAKLAALRLFLVGSGALGCEYLKGLAMMGVGSAAAGGSVTVTDMDNIELSNLNRQFLFRLGDIGRPKSVVAAGRARQMNPDFAVVPLETRVGPDTEVVFGDQFWERLDCVCNALDNVSARRYVDGRCVFFGRPLLEAGTLGTKANTQVVVPHLTQSYSDQKDVAEDAIPLCTLKNFPYKIEHCIEFARSEFEGWFSQAPHEAVLYLADPRDYLGTLRGRLRDPAAQAEALRAVLTVLETAADASLERCVDQAVTLFCRAFRDPVLDITHHYPEDHVDPRSGALYWSGPKRFPKPIELRASDEGVLDFVVATASLLARCCEIEVRPAEHTREYFRGRLAAAARSAPEYRPGAVRVLGQDATTASAAATTLDANLAEAALSAIEESLEVTARRLTAARGGDVELRPQEFEKDDDSNFHIDFVAAFSNLRARNYRIPETTRHDAKMISGKIIPAMATTTAAVTGLALIELVKLVQHLPLDAYKESNINLAVNHVVLMSPGPPPRVASKAFDVISGCPVRALPEGFTNWDRTVVRTGRDLTIEELEAELRRLTGADDLELSVLATREGAMLYGPQLAAAVRKETVTQRVLATTGSPPDPRKPYMILTPILGNDAGDDVLIPLLVYYWAAA